MKRGIVLRRCKHVNGSLTLTRTRARLRCRDPRVMTSEEGRREPRLLGSVAIGLVLNQSGRTAGAAAAPANRHVRRVQGELHARAPGLLPNQGLLRQGGCRASGQGHRAGPTPPIRPGRSAGLLTSPSEGHYTRVLRHRLAAGARAQSMRTRFLTERYNGLQ